MLSPSIAEQYWQVAKFKADFHHIQIPAKKEIVGVWYELPYMVEEEDIETIISWWSSAWLTPMSEGAEEGGTTGSKPTMQKRKKDTEVETLENGGDDILGINLGTDPFDPSSPFTTKRRKGGAWKKVKFDRSTGPTDMVLTEWDIEEIRDSLWQVNEGFWRNIKY